MLVTTTFLAYRQPLANYIDSLVALGGAYWDDMKSATSFVGVGIQGVTVPLRDGMTVPTNNNFVAGDLNQLTGLKGDGSTKYIATGVSAATDLLQNDASISVYPTSDRDVGATSLYIASNASNFSVVNNATGFRSRHFNSTLSTNGTSTSVGGLIGISRDNASDYDWYDVGATGTNAEASVSQVNLTIGVFAGGDGSLINSSRLATYHIGPALDLATLEGLQDTLITEIAAIPILDVYPSAAAAYSLRALSSSFASNAVVRVRRDSDNAELDFTATEVSDGTLLTWVGTGGTDNGFVETWYDQSGNGNDAIQLTAGSQPKIVSAGVAIVENGKPTVEFNLDTLLFDSSINNTASTIIAIAELYGQPLLGNSGSRNFFNPFGTSVWFQQGGGKDEFTGFSNAGQVLGFWYRDGSNPSDLYENGAALTRSVSGISNQVGVHDGIGTVSGRPFSGSLQELIIYSTDKSTNRTGIESNINNAYDIY